MHYPDYSQLWLSDVKDGRAEALGDVIDSSALDCQKFVPLSDLKPTTTEDGKVRTSLGKRTSLGCYNDEPLTWTVISVNHDSALLLCDTVVSAIPLYRGEIDSSAPGWWCETPAWPNTDVRQWLNFTFYREAFGGAVESAFIEPAFGDRSPNPDKVVILSAEEGAAYVPQEIRACSVSSWWLREPSSRNADGEPTYVNKQGEVCAGGSAHDFRGVRPLITVKLWA